MKGNALPIQDGLTSCFYQSYWDIIGKEGTENALNILNINNNVSPINKTFICLIPKVRKPTIPSDYPHISLYNMILKIITKTISNKIKPMLNNIIQRNQSSFTPGSLITDNIILTFEAFHTLNKNTSTNKWRVAMKLDMAKTYDTMEWTFIEKLLTLWDALVSW